MYKRKESRKPNVPDLFNFYKIIECLYIIKWAQKYNRTTVPWHLEIMARSLFRIWIINYEPIRRYGVIQSKDELSNPIRIGCELIWFCILFLHVFLRVFHYFFKLLNISLYFFQGCTNTESLIQFQIIFQIKGCQ